MCKEKKKYFLLSRVNLISYDAAAAGVWLIDTLNCISAQSEQ